MTYKRTKRITEDSIRDVWVQFAACIASTGNFPDYEKRSQWAQSVALQADHLVHEYRTRFDDNYNESSSI